MPQAVVDPEELREFARALKKFNNDLRERMGRLNSQLASLGTSWRDQEHKKFCGQYDEHMKIISRFLETSDRHVPYLIKKADQVDDYLQS